MEYTDSFNNFIVEPPKFSWLNFAYHEELLKSKQQPNSDERNKTFYRGSGGGDEENDSRSQSFIELTKLLSDDCQYGLLDEYAGTKEEREEQKRLKELRKQKAEEKRREREIAEIEDKIKKECKALDELLDKANNQDNDTKEIEEENKEKEEGVESDQMKKEQSLQNISLEKIDTDKLGKKDFNKVPYSAPVKSNREQNFKEFGLDATSIDKLNRRNSYDQYVIQLNEPWSDGISRQIASVRPMNSIAILSNNFTTSIEIKKPKSKDNDINFFKAFLNGELSKEDLNNDHEEEKESFPSCTNHIEKFKPNESSESLDILLENVNIKCSTSFDLPRNGSLESLESVDIGKDKSIQNDENNDSWISNFQIIPILGKSKV